MQLPKRKDIRLKNHDYSQKGAYFITLCVKDRHHLLWDNPVGATSGRPIPGGCPLPLSGIGKVIDAEIHKIGFIYENVLIDKYVIMPNHIHMIIVLNDGENGRCEKMDDRRSPLHWSSEKNKLSEHPTISRIVQQFKGSISKQVGFSIWQKLFYDHIIRSEDEYRKIWEYIDMNPINWQNDDYYETIDKGQTHKNPVGATCGRPPLAVPRVSS